MSKFMISLISLWVVIACTLSASNGRFPVAYQRTKGWITVEQSPDTNESSLTFDFSSISSNATEIDWSILETPFIYGEENCGDLLRRRRLNGSSTSGTLKMGKSNSGSPNWRGSVVLKGISLSKLQARSILLTSGVDKNRQAIGCANILSDDVLVFESRFYGPQVAGGVYFFLDTATKTLKLHNRLINGNNFEDSLSWTLKNRWWSEDNSREPVWQSCRVKGEKADQRYDPPPNLASLQPESLELLEIANWKIVSDGGESSTKDDLTASILVLIRQSSEYRWHSEVFGCSRIRRSDGWSAQASATVKNQTSEQFVSFKQDTLFHPVLVRFKAPQLQTVATLKTAPTTNGSFLNSTQGPRKNLNTLAPPTFSLRERTLSSSDEVDCRQKAAERLNLLSLDNSLPVESDEANEDNVVYAAYFTDAALESVMNNLLAKTIAVQWPKENLDLCGAIRPSPEDTIFAQSSFYYPFVGAVTFAQPKNRPESTTIVSGDLRHLFDDKPSANVDWQIDGRTIDSTVDDMTCKKDRDQYDPVLMGVELCKKSKATCSIGALSDQLGRITIGTGMTNSNGSGLFGYATRNAPLAGPYSIVGQTLKIQVSAGFKGCSNITYVPSMGEDSCMSHAAISDRQLVYQGAVASFFGTGGLNGTIFLFQSNRAEKDAVPSSSTTICNQMQLSNDLKLSSLIFELLNTTDNADKVCRNSSVQIYDPFFVRDSKVKDSAFCSRIASMCAIGDLTHKVQSVPFNQCGCTKFLPASGPFGVNGRVLRIRRSDTKEIMACTTFKFWQLQSLDVYVQDTFSERQLASAVAEEFHLADEQVDVSLSRDEIAASKYKGCSLYSISIFDPDSDNITDTLSSYKMNRDSSWTNKWGSNKCANAAASILRLSVFTAICAILVALSNRVINI